MQGGSSCAISVCASIGAERSDSSTFGRRRRRPASAERRAAGSAAPSDCATASTSALDAEVTELPTMSAALVPGAHSPVNLTPDPVRGRPPTSIFEWIRLFCVYESVYVDRHPSESAALFTYMVNDERFRRIHAMAPALPWHLINWDVAMGAIHSSFVDRQAAP